MKSFTISLLAFASLHAAEANVVAPSGANTQLERIATEAEARRSALIKRHVEDYRSALKSVEADATTASDSVVAAAARAELDSPDLGLRAMQLDGAVKSSRLSRLRSVRAGFDKARLDVDTKILTWCREELTRVEQQFLAARDQASAAVVRKEILAVSRPPLIIVSAIFGASGRNLDITHKLRKAIRFNRLSVQGGCAFAGGDPLPYVKKWNAITWRLGDGRMIDSGFGEDARIELPPP